MASKQRIVNTLIDIRGNLNKDLNYIDGLEMGRLYKFNGRHGTTFETYGFVLGFNKQSFRVQVISSDDPYFEQTKTWRDGHYDRWSFNFGTPYTKVKESDLPLLLGKKFVHDALYRDIINGKKRLKMDK